MKTLFCMSTAKVLGLSLSLACPEVFNSTISENFFFANTPRELFISLISIYLLLQQSRCK